MRIMHVPERLFAIGKVLVEPFPQLVVLQDLCHRIADTVDEGIERFTREAFDKGSKEGDTFGNMLFRGRIGDE